MNKQDLIRHESFMNRCIQLAKRGKANVKPNPMVGCVIVHEGLIIGEGYHQKYGDPHAEVNAVKSVKNKDLLPYSTLYVNLEPCAHHGKTPPCSDLIIRHKIKRVVIGCIDSYSEVSGKGIERMRKAGVEVIVGICEEKSKQLNKRFFAYHNKKRPYIILKWAETQDGLLDKSRTSNEPKVNWITSPKTQQLTHIWRDCEDAILVGKNTVLNDNPSLTCRAVTGINPTRLTIDKKLVLDNSYAILDDQSKTIVFNLEENGSFQSNNEFVKLNQNNIEQQILDYCYENKIQSIIVEGGAFTLNSFIQKGIWDEARVLVGPKHFKVGTKAPNMKSSPSKNLNINQDILKIYYNS